MTEQEYYEKETDLLKGIPEELRAALSHLAYEQGHSFGFSEIHIQLSDLVDALEEPLKKLVKRLGGEQTSVAQCLHPGTFCGSSCLRCGKIA